MHPAMNHGGDPISAFKDLADNPWSERYWFPTVCPASLLDKQLPSPLRLSPPVSDAPLSAKSHDAKPGK
jgi:hypothetical protein